MKYPVEVALIFCGAFLVSLPYISNAVGVYQVALLVKELEGKASLTGNMPWYADGVCMLGGFLMIVCALASYNKKAKLV